MKRKIASRQIESKKKDDGPRHRVVDLDGKSIYPGLGVSLEEAKRQADSLIIETKVVPVDDEEDQ